MFSLLIFLLSPIWTDRRWWPVWKTSSHTICLFSSLFSAQPNSRKLLSLLYSLSFYPVQNQRQLNVVKRMIDFQLMNNCCYSIVSLYVLCLYICLYFLRVYVTSSTYIFCSIMYVIYYYYYYYYFPVFNWTFFCLNRYWRRILTGKMCSGHRRVFGLQEKNTHLLGFIFYL